MGIRVSECILVSMFLLIVIGCTAQQQHDYSHWKSDLIGLKRKITLYSASGTPVRTWQGRYKVEIHDGVVRFLHDGKAIILSGTYTIEEQ